MESLYDFRVKILPEKTKIKNHRTKNEQNYILIKCFYPLDQISIRFYMTYTIISNTDDYFQPSWEISSGLKRRFTSPLRVITSWSPQCKVDRGRDTKISNYYQTCLLSEKSTLLGQTVTLGGNLFWWTRQVISILISMSEMFENIYFGSPVLIIPGFPGS